jgi:type II secretory pathway pseudopilin PulG
MMGQLPAVSIEAVRAATDAAARLLRRLSRASGRSRTAARPQPSTTAFTLIETMIAVMVFGMMILLFASSILTTRMSARMNGQYAQAVSLCQHKIDQLRAVGYGRTTYTELNDAEIIDDTPANAPYSFTQVDDVASVLTSPTTSVVFEDAGANTVRVTVTITWKQVSFKSKTSTASLIALITNVE